MKLGDIVSHKTNSDWKRGKIYAIIPGDKPMVTVMWGNGDLEHCSLDELEPLGWNIYERGY